MSTRPSLSVLHRAVVALLFLAATTSAAPNVAGGGPASTDCFVEFDVGQAPAVTKGATTKISCTDCDPACDANGGKNGRCRLDFLVCPKQIGGSCNASTDLGTIHVAGASPVGAPVDPRSSSCKPYQAEARVKHRLHGDVPGRRTIKVKVSSLGRPKRTDQDTIIYTCVPRTGACPPAPSSTTTTTTTLPQGCSVASVPSEGQTHVMVGTTVNYANNPPSSGPHYPVWATYSEHLTTVPREYWVHDLEHGAIVFLYRPDAPTDVVTALRAAYQGLPADPVCGHKLAVMTPDPLLDRPFALVAWTYVLRCDTVDTQQILAFTAAHRRMGPEMLCVDGTHP